jgi:glycosyltransferase involved in cell wall biosynthesis
MSAGRPLAGTSLGLAGLGLNSGVSALIADEPFDLAVAIERLCRDDGYASTLTRNARQLVDARFSWDFIGRRYLEVVLEAHARRTDQEAV